MLSIDRFAEIFGLEMYAWCQGLKSYPGEMYDDLLRAIIHDLEESFHECVVHRYSCSFTVLAESFAEVTRSPGKVERINFWIFDELAGVLFRYPEAMQMLALLTESRVNPPNEGNEALVESIDHMLFLGQMLNDAWVDCPSLAETYWHSLDQPEPVDFVRPRREALSQFWQRVIPGGDLCEIIERRFAAHVERGKTTSRSRDSSPKPVLKKASPKGGSREAQIVAVLGEGYRVLFGGR